VTVTGKKKRTQYWWVWPGLFVGMPALFVLVAAVAMWS
jgi:uncharacterized membrane protein YhaH (DUF805 family)